MGATTHQTTSMRCVARTRGETKRLQQHEHNGHLQQITPRPWDKWYYVDLHQLPLQDLGLVLSYQHEMDGFLTRGVVYGGLAHAWHMSATCLGYRPFINLPSSG